MKILIMSDTHTIPKSALIDILNHIEYDHFIHCGDIYMNYTQGDLGLVQLVRGNNDFNDSPSQISTIIDQKKFFITHGHHYDIGFTMSTIQEHCQGKYDVVCFGHSHIPLKEEINGTLYINPGSLCYPRGRCIHPTYCILDSQTMEVTYYDKNHQVLDPFEQVASTSYFKRIFKF